MALSHPADGIQTAIPLLPQPPPPSARPASSGNFTIRNGQIADGPAPIAALLPTLNYHRPSDWPSQPHISFLARRCIKLHVILHPSLNILYKFNRFKLILQGCIVTPLVINARSNRLHAQVIHATYSHNLVQERPSFILASISSVLLNPPTLRRSGSPQLSRYLSSDKAMAHNVTLWKLVHMSSTQWTVSLSFPNVCTPLTHTRLNSNLSTLQCSTGRVVYLILILS